MEGLKLSIRHLYDAKDSREPFGVADEQYFKQQTGQVTLQYPHESIPVPDNGRYRLHNEIDDCIVCDKCAKICPVNCIEIEPVRAVGEIGKTSDGTTRRIYAARFDIDMGKCCFCGLCTTVCPTECLTMTKAYDFSEYDIDNHIYSFAEMSPLEILEKKKQFEEFQKAKEAAKAPKVDTAKEEVAEREAKKTAPGKPVFKPRVKPKVPSDKKNVGDPNKEEDQKAKARPVFKPKIKPKTGTSDEIKKKEEPEDPRAAALKIMQGKKAGQEGEKAAKPRPVFRPKIKPKTDPAKSPEQEVKSKKPVIKPKITSIKKDAGEEKQETSATDQSRKEIKPVVKPKIKPGQNKEEDKSSNKLPEENSEKHFEKDKLKTEKKSKPGKPRPVIKKRDKG